MLFDSRKNLNLESEYIGWKKDFELKTSKNSFVEILDETYETFADWFILELSVYDFEDRTYNNSLHVCHCRIKWDCNYLDGQGYGAGYNDFHFPQGGQISCSGAYYGDIDAVKTVCKELKERVRWSLSEKDFLIVNRAILAAFEDFCKTYYK